MSVDSWAVEFTCGCIYEWGTREGFAGMWPTEPCEKHDRKAEGRETPQPSNAEPSPQSPAKEKETGSG